MARTTYSPVVEVHLRCSEQEFVATAGRSLVCAPSVMRTLREIERLNPAVVVLHLTSGEREEIELIRRLARGSRSRQVIVVAAAHSLETEQMVRAAGATVYLEDATPEVLDAAVAACTRAVQRNALLAEDADRAAAHRNGSTDACRQDGAWRPEKDGSEQ